MTANWQWPPQQQQQLSQYNVNNDNILIINNKKCFQAAVHAGNLFNIVPCKIVCSEDLIWKAGKTFWYVVNKYFSI